MRTSTLLAALCAGMVALSGCQDPRNGVPASDAGEPPTTDAGSKQCPASCPQGTACDSATGECVACSETDDQFCSRLAIQCGPASGLDKCGQQREVAECCAAGPCSADICGGGDAGLDGGMPLNDTCDTAATIAFDGNGHFQATGDTTSAHNDTQSLNCLGGGNDLLYSFTIADPKDVTISLLPQHGSGLDPIVSIRRDCAAKSSELSGGCSDAPYGSTVASFTLKTLPAGTYFIVVDGYSGTAGPFTLTVDAVTPPPPPANDTCASPEPLDLSSGHAQVTGTTAGADNTAAGSCNGWGQAPDVVYSFSIASPRKLTARVTGSRGLDPVVYLRSACGDAVTEIPSGCALAPAGSTTATLNVGSLPAGSYFLFVDGYDASAGGFTLTIDVAATPPVPANDTCASPEALLFDANGHAQTQGDTSSAHDDDRATCGGIGGDVYFTFTTNETKKAAFRLSGGSGGFDPVLSIRSSCGPGSFSELPQGCAQAPTGSPDASLLFGRLPAGTYYLVVDGYNGSSGPFTLSADLSTPEPPPANDACGAGVVALSLSGGSTSVAGSTLYALNNFSATCANADGPDVVYSFQLAAHSKVTATVTPDSTVAGYWPVVTILSDCASLSSAAEMTCGSGGPAVANDLPAGTYYLVVDGAYSTAGSFTLNVAVQPWAAGPANDSCGSVQALTLLNDSVSVDGSTLGALDQTGPAVVCADWTGKDVVYSLTTSDVRKITATVTPLNKADNYRPAVYLGSSCATWNANTLGACAKAASPTAEASATIPAAAPGTWYVWVDSGGFSRSAGTFNLTVTAAPATALPNDRCDGAIALTKGVPVSGDTTTATNDYGSGPGTAACGGYKLALTGHDLVYSYTPAAAGDFTVTVTADPASTFAPAVFVSQNLCGDTGTCLARAEGLGGPVSATVTAARAATPYFIVVDAALYSDWGPFTVEVR